MKGVSPETKHFSFSIRSRHRDESLLAILKLHPLLKQGGDPSIQDLIFSSQTSASTDYWGKFERWEGGYSSEKNHLIKLILTFSHTMRKTPSHEFIFRKHRRVFTMHGYDPLLVLITRRTDQNKNMCIAYAECPDEKT